MTTITFSPECIFEKTSKGREEIATRQFGLASRLRSLLVLVDGKASKTDLLRKVSGMGLDDRSLQELVDSEFIGRAADATPASTEQLIAPAGSAPPVQNAPAAAPALEVAAAPAVETLPLTAAATSGMNTVDQIFALKKFFNDTIKSNLGLRGFSFQLRVERAGTLTEFRALREPYLDAIMKAKGRDAALALVARLDQHLSALEQQ